MIEEKKDTNKMRRREAAAEGGCGEERTSKNKTKDK